MISWKGKKALKTNELIDALGIEKEKVDALKDNLRREAFYRNILFRAGVLPDVIELIMRTIDPTEIDTSQEELLTEKARIEWAGFIPTRKK